MEFSKKMEGTNLNDVACCPNGYKLVVGNNHINLRENKYFTTNNNQCDAGDKMTKYTGGGYIVYRNSDDRGRSNSWILQNGNNWTKHKGGEECCPRDGKMIMFESAPCNLAGNPICSWPQGIKAEIQCA